MKTYPIDLPGAKRLGIENWLESFSCPIPGEEHIRVHQQVTAAFANALPAQETSRRRLLGRGHQL